VKTKLLVFVTWGLLTVAAVGCASGTNSELRALAAAYDSDGVADLPAGTIVSAKVGTLCTTGDAVTVESIVPSAPTGGLQVDFWAIQPNEFQVDPKGEHLGGVTGARFPVTPGQATGDKAIVTGKCPPSLTVASVDVLSQVLVTASRPTAVTASTPGFTVTYRAGGRRFSMLVPHGLTLCAPGDRRTQGC